MRLHCYWMIHPNVNLDYMHYRPTGKLHYHAAALPEKRDRRKFWSRLNEVHTLPF
jgi:hypothetical protein